VFLRIVIIIVVTLAAVLIYAATRPDTLHITRSTVIRASPETIFALINDFHYWVKWAPQDREDPTMARSYSGAPSGAGAISEWKGAGSTGEGRMSITESLANSKISVTVDFERPFKAHNRNQFTLEPGGSSTNVTWSMEGTNVYMAKVMSVFVNMDRMMGKHFEAGLDNLRTLAEK
jgi:uncharacterized protein YndB with AHSA1/START domain